MPGLKILVLSVILLVSANRIFGRDDGVVDDIRVDETNGREALHQDTYTKSRYQEYEELNEKIDDNSDDGDDDEYDDDEDDDELDEEDYEEAIRVQMYEEHGYEWPIPELVPDTPGWNKLMRSRLEQVEQLEERLDRYNGYVSTLTMALVAPNFTESGWGLTRAPEELVSYLKKNLHEGLDKATPEVDQDVIQGASENWQPPLFIRQRSLNQLVLEELQPMHEAWAGVPLIGENAYGLRVYRNQSILHMHVDHGSSHVISCILHVDHDENSEPWPLFIEDFQGNTNEVVLESGDLLFYESSKCLHGRPRPFNGEWYSSIFVHFYPRKRWKPKERGDEPHIAVPPHWMEPQNDNPELNKLQMIGTSFTEPDCPNMWCNTLNSVKWSGPGEDGKIISSGSHQDLSAKDLSDEL